jgi:DNA-binding Xre family transcriptional regulator
LVEREGEMAIRLRVKEVAEEKGFSMTKLSHRSEVAYYTVHAIFKDPYRQVTYATLDKLAKALGVTVSDLVEEVPDD